MSRRQRRISWSRFFRQTLKAYAPVLQRNFTRASVFDLMVRPYLGKAGPKTFTGTPEQVVRIFREWQRKP